MKDIITLKKKSEDQRIFYEALYICHLWGNKSKDGTHSIFSYRTKSPERIHLSISHRIDPETIFSPWEKLNISDNKIFPGKKIFSAGCRRYVSGDVERLACFYVDKNDLSLNETNLIHILYEEIISPREIPTKNLARVYG